MYLTSLLVNLGSSRLNEKMSLHQKTRSESGFGLENFIRWFQINIILQNTLSSRTNLIS